MITYLSGSEFQSQHLVENWAEKNGTQSTMSTDLAGAGLHLRSRRDWKLSPLACPLGDCRQQDVCPQLADRGRAGALGDDGEVKVYASLVTLRLISRKGNNEPGVGAIAGSTQRSFRDRNRSLTIAKITSRPLQLLKSSLREFWNRRPWSCGAVRL